MDSVLEKFLIENLIYCPVLATLFLGHTWFLSQRNFQEYDLYSMYCFTCLQFLCCSFWLFPLQFLNSSWFISYCNVGNNMILNGYIICAYSEFSWSVYSCILAEYGEILLSLRVQFECVKIRTKKNPNTNTFYVLFRTYEQYFSSG